MIRKEFTVLKLLFCCVIFCESCKQKIKTTETHQVRCVKQATLPLKYTRGFSVDYYNGFKLVTVKDWRDSSKIYSQYVLLPEGKPAPLDFTGAMLVDIPVRRIICVSTNHIAMLTHLNLLDSIAGVANVDLIYDSMVVAKINHNQIANIGSNSRITILTVPSLKSLLENIFASPTGYGSFA